MQLEYRPTQSLALPHSLLTQITQPNGLILEDQQGYYLLYSEASLGAHHLKMRLDKDPNTRPRQRRITYACYFMLGCVYLWALLLRHSPSV